jgi:tetratricopeptide (TPR) repeat protein
MVAAAASAALMLCGCGGSRSASTESKPAPVPAREEADHQIRYLQALTQRQPRHWRARVRLASLYTETARPREAFESLRDAVRQAPNNVGLYAVTAESAATLDWVDWAIYGWRQVLRLAPGDAEARVRLSQLCRSLGWLGEAHQLLDEAIRLSPHSLAVLREKAAFEMSAGHAPAARAWAQRLKKEYPGSPYGYSLTADLEATAGHWRQAIDEGRQAIQRAPDDAVFLVRQAEYQLLRPDAPDPTAALQLLEQALEVEPESLPARYWMALVLRRTGRSAEALTQLEAVYRQSPDFMAARQQLSDLYRTAGRRADADRLIAEADQAGTKARELGAALSRVAREPGSAAAHVSAARAQLDNGSAGAAVAECLTARSLDPKEPEAAKLLEAALKAQGRSSETLPPAGAPARVAQARS